jgi:putative nucleotidyltransferase with HDIG domain
VRAQATEGTSESESLVALASSRTPDAMAHADRVTRYALSVARELGADRDLHPLLEAAARFHDIGKAAMPDALLTKPSPLTPGELAIMRRHVDVGADILAATETLAGAAPIVRASHEWYNGGGYPRKLAGAQIPLASRIISVADGYDAMTQHRSYRRGAHANDAIAELLRCSLTQFDPQIVDAFLGVLGRH